MRCATVTSFTPGPWRFNADERTVEAGAELTKSIICGVHGWDVDYRANARLIAAAPRMADLLLRWTRQGIALDLAQETRDALRQAGVLDADA